MSKRSKLLLAGLIAAALGMLWWGQSAVSNMADTEDVKMQTFESAVHDAGWELVPGTASPRAITLTDEYLEGRVRFGGCQLGVTAPGHTPKAVMLHLTTPTKVAVSFPLGEMPQATLVERLGDYGLEGCFKK